MTEKKVHYVSRFKEVSAKRGKKIPISDLTGQALYNLLVKDKKKGIEHHYTQGNKEKIDTFTYDDLFMAEVKNIVNEWEGLSWAVSTILGIDYDDFSDEQNDFIEDLYNNSAKAQKYILSNRKILELDQRMKRVANDFLDDLGLEKNSFIVI